MKTEIEKEMQLFENECKVLCYKGNMSRSNLGSFYNNEQTNWMYQMWLSSKNREGYKLVPVELVDEIEDKIWDNLSANHTITNQEGDGFIPVEDIDLGGIYKAMIGAADE